MSSQKTVKISRKLVFYGVFSTFFISLAVGLIALWQLNRVEGISGQETQKLAAESQEHIVRGILSLLTSQKELLEQKLGSDLNVALDLARRSGPLSLGSELIPWQAVNQFTQETQPVLLPKLLSGGSWLGQNGDSAIDSPIVDRVRELVGGTCTIFQRINDAGDMMRVVTNVLKSDGKRAIGTFIPVRNPDGSPNPVLQTVLGGKRFLGRAFVVDRWYMTAYEPMTDSDGRIIAVLYVGVPEESARSLRRQIMEIKVGESGYVYVLDREGRYVISKDGKRDGENIWAARDSDGTLFIQDIIRKALALDSGEFARVRYPWQNPGDLAPRYKTVTIGYFAPWQWIIGAGTWDEEYLKGQRAINEANRQSEWVMLLVLIFSLGLVILLWLFVSRSIVRPIRSLVERAQDLAEGSIDMTQRLNIEKADELGELAGWFNRFLDRLQGMIRDIAESSGAIGASTALMAGRSRDLSERTTQQAAALTQTTVTLEQFSKGVKTNSENAVTAECGLADVNADLEDKVLLIDSVSSTMDEIHQSSSQISKIVTVINDISFQTNLLALNAAVEAARAGDSGRGFAVVAAEVRNLAQKTAESALTIQEIVSHNVNSTEKGRVLVRETAEFFSEIKETLSEISQLIAHISSLSAEQQTGIGQINTAVNEIDGLGSDNARMSAEFIDLTVQLKSQTDKLDDLVALFTLE